MGQKAPIERGIMFSEKISEQIRRMEDSMNNPEAYEFINSKDVRGHLASLNCQLTPAQCAFLVWQSKRHTLELHAMLHGYMAFEQKLLSRFQSDENGAVYEYEAWERAGENGYHWNGGFRLFRTYDTCYQRAQEYAKEENCRFRIIKRYIDTSPGASDYDPNITVEYDESGHIMDVSLYDNYNFFSRSEEEQAVWNESFTGMWFDIPIPFVKGDIVCDNANIHTAGIPFVLWGTDPWYRKKHAEADSFYADYSDMNAVGYSYDHAHRFFDDDFMVDYLNLEYYKEPLCGPERLLYAYSQFVKEKIDAYTLLKLYRMIRAEAAAEEERSILKSYLHGDVWEKYT